jgi:hypothetical protein
MQTILVAWQEFLEEALAALIVAMRIITTIREMSLTIKIGASESNLILLIKHEE